MIMFMTACDDENMEITCYQTGAVMTCVIKSSSQARYCEIAVPPDIEPNQVFLAFRQNAPLARRQLPLRVVDASL